LTTVKEQNKLIWKVWLQKIKEFLQDENLDRLILFITAMIGISTVSLSWLEPNLSLFDAFWWCIVTLTTVGYGDIAPVTFGGRMIGIINMIVGIGLFATLSATTASLLIGQKLREEWGMNSYNFTDHIILCEWNLRAKVILEELRLEPQTKEKPIVLIANIERKPLDDHHLFFIQGQVSDETLHRANLMQSKTVIILGDVSLEATARDGKVVLSTLTVKSINPDTYTIVELVNEAYVPTCKRAKADEIIVSTELSNKLIYQAIFNQGITQVVTNLLSCKSENQFYKIPVTASQVGLSFLEVFMQMKEVHQSIVVAVQKGSEGQIISNPPVTYEFEENDYLIALASKNPKR